MKAIKYQVLILLSSFLWGYIGLVYGQNGQTGERPERIRKLPIDFKQKYQGDDYNYKESISFWEKANAWLIDKIGSWFSINGSRASTIFENIKFIFYVLVILGVVYIIVKIILNNEGHWIFKRNKEEKESLSYEIGEDIQEIDFNALIHKAIKNNDFRMAIRYHYLLLLKQLDYNKVITFENQKTAYDYELELDGTKYSVGFSKATYYYTYIWYGGFYIDENEYASTSSTFSKLIQQFANE